jgi:hypothetical protein
VAHCGGSLEGNFIWSAPYTDIYSGGTADRAVGNKGAAGVVERTVPFEFLGFECDNSNEFLNWHLVDYFTDRKEKVGFTQSRYRKNDTGHVKQKNWTHVRQPLGYDRLGDPDFREPINRL